MTKPVARRRSSAAPPREWLNAPTLLILAAGMLVFLAFQYSFALAIGAGIFAGLTGWLWWRSRLRAAPRPRRQRRPAARRR